ncbi:MAG TPA: carboxypeptidase-like regulatory domain-containing protein [Gemmatirosa sp.]
MANVVRFRQAHCALVVLLALAACSRGESRPAHTGTAAAHDATRTGAVPHDVTLPGVTASEPAYVVRPATDAGRVTGSVQLDGPAPADTIVTPGPDDVRTCGRSLTLPAVETRGGGVAGAVVWLVGVAAGKPFPELRRSELALEGCRLRPHIVAAVAGGALNVHGIDELDARLRFTRVEGGTSADGPGAVLLRVTTTDAGQVVPSERVIATPGTVEVRGELQPWLRAWVLAFDHPYFATTDATGAFTLDGVPPGTYQLVAWHDRLGRSVQRVTVAPGAGVTADVRLGGAGPR